MINPDFVSERVEGSVVNEKILGPCDIWFCKYPPFKPKGLVSRWQLCQMRL